MFIIARFLTSNDKGQSYTPIIEPVSSSLDLMLIISPPQQTPLLCFYCLSSLCAKVKVFLTDAKLSDLAALRSLKF